MIGVWRGLLVLLHVAVVRSSWTLLCNGTDVTTCGTLPAAERTWTASASTGNYFYTFGGTSDQRADYVSAMKDDLWRMTYDPLSGQPSWLEICSACVVRPLPRFKALMGIVVLEDSAESEYTEVHSVYVFGGEGGLTNGSDYELLNDIWRIDVDSASGAVIGNWTELCTDEACVASRPQSLGSMASVNDKIFLFGANVDDRDPDFNTVYAYDPMSATDQWEIVCQNGNASRCCGASGCPVAREVRSPILPSDGEELFYVFDGFIDVDDPLEPAVWAFNTTDEKWSLVCSESTFDGCFNDGESSFLISPDGRRMRDYASTLANERIYLFGGNDQRFAYGDLWSLSTDGSQASLVCSSTLCDPNPAERTLAVMFHLTNDNSIFLYGGNYDGVLYGDLWRFELPPPTTLPPAPAPAPTSAPTSAPMPAPTPDPTEPTVAIDSVPPVQVESTLPSSTIAAIVASIVVLCLIVAVLSLRRVRQRVLKMLSIADGAGDKEVQMASATNESDDRRSSWPPSDLATSSRSTADGGDGDRDQNGDHDQNSSSARLLPAADDSPIARKLASDASFDSDGFEATGGNPVVVVGDMEYENPELSFDSSGSESPSVAKSTRRPSTSREGVPRPQVSQTEIKHRHDLSAPKDIERKPDEKENLAELPTDSEYDFEVFSDSEFSEDNADEASDSHDDDEAPSNSGVADDYIEIEKPRAGGGAVASADGADSNALKCPVCGKQFRENCNLITHKREQHGKQAKRFVCSFPKCLKSFHRKHNMRVHMRIHTPNVNKNFHCELCDQYFPQKANFLRHMDVTHERPGKCPRPGCDARVASIADFHSHCLSAHPRVSLGSLKPRVRNKKGFQCYCKLVFKSLDDKAKHQAAHCQATSDKRAYVEDVRRNAGTLRGEHQHRGRRPAGATAAATGSALSRHAAPASISPAPGGPGPVPMEVANPPGYIPSINAGVPTPQSAPPHNLSAASGTRTDAAVGHDVKSESAAGYGVPNSFFGASFAQQPAMHVTVTPTESLRQQQPTLVLGRHPLSPTGNHEYEAASKELKASHKLELEGSSGVAPIGGSFPNPLDASHWPHEGATTGSISGGSTAQHVHGSPTGAQSFLFPSAVGVQTPQRTAYPPHVAESKVSNPVVAEEPGAAGSDFTPITKDELQLLDVARRFGILEELKRLGSGVPITEVSSQLAAALGKPHTAGSGPGVAPGHFNLPIGSSQGVASYDSRKPEFAATTPPVAISSGFGAPPPHQLSASGVPSLVYQNPAAAAAAASSPLAPDEKRVSNARPPSIDSSQPSYFPSLSSLAMDTPEGLRSISQRSDLYSSISPVSMASLPSVERTLSTPVAARGSISARERASRYTRASSFGTHGAVLQHTASVGQLPSGGALSSMSDVADAPDALVSGMPSLSTGAISIEQPSLTLDHGSISAWDSVPSHVMPSSSSTLEAALQHTANVGQLLTGGALSSTPAVAGAQGASMTGPLSLGTGPMSVSSTSLGRHPPTSARDPVSAQDNVPESSGFWMPSSSSAQATEALHHTPSIEQQLADSLTSTHAAAANASGDSFFIPSLKTSIPVIPKLHPERMTDQTLAASSSQSWRPAPACGEKLEPRGRPSSSSRSLSLSDATGLGTEPLSVGALPPVVHGDDPFSIGGGFGSEVSGSSREHSGSPSKNSDSLGHRIS